LKQRLIAADPLWKVQGEVMDPDHSSFEKSRQVAGT